MVDWPHAPVHRFRDAGIYFVTGGTLHKQHLFREPPVLDRLQELLFEKAQFHGVTLHAWSLFSNHYHLVASADAGERVRAMVTKLHVDSAIRLNERDGLKGRRVWFQFWDLQLTQEAAWLARLRYTHENAVHHGLAGDATNYPWCSASWFARTAPAAFVRTVRRMKISILAADDPLD
jgi:putative transposase